MATTEAPDSERYQWEELRLALIMNGGVSLAVWMGGVTNEIFRLVTHQHPVYRGLMKMTRTSPRVDVISGTSAGGVNGAALAVALLYGGNFARLRDVWMKTGAFTDLLRHPVGTNPGSLLRGEDYYLPALEQAFKDLAPAGTPQFEAGEMPIDLRLTATLLSGHQGRNVDDLGAPLHDVDYRAQFRFERKSSALPGAAPKPDAFEKRESMVKVLARAARSTSSFPFAFEPSLVSPEDAGRWLVNNQQVTLKTPRYVVDGGVMDNKPFRGAREGIFAMHRRGGVRRVLAYINPDPGDGKPFDLPDKPTMPVLARVLAASIIGIPQSQSISDELEEIESHNLDVRMRRESVLSLAAAFKDKTYRLGSMASDLFDVYRKRRLAATFELFVFRPLSNAASRKPEYAKALSLIGKHGKETLKQDFIAQGGAGWLPSEWPEWSDHPDNQCSQAWGWGLFPVEFASKLMMNMLRMMQSLAEYRAAAAGHQAFTPPLEEAPDDGGRAGADWMDSGNEGWQPEQLRAHLERVLEPRLDTARYLENWWKEAYFIVDQILVMRDQERIHWRENMDQALGKLSAYTECVCTGQLLAWQHETMKALFSQISDTGRRASCAELAYQIATVIREASQEVPALVAALPRRSDPEAPPPLLQADEATVEALLSLARIFNKSSVEETLYTLLQMEVVEFAFNDHETMSSDSLIELVQISGNSKSTLGGCEHAVDKLLGLQLAHFGAFYKESWRANDWIYGRLDGASRLVSVLLSAKRLHQIYARPHGAAAAVAAIRNIAKDSVPAGPLRNYLEQAWRAREAAITKELLFLQEPDQNVPDQLPNCAAAIELRLHLGILREELPELGAAVQRDQDNGADPMWSGNSLVKNLRAAEGRSDAPFSPEQAVAQLRSGLLAGTEQRGENFTKEAGSDLFTRTLAHTIATLQNTLSSKSARLGPLSVLFAALWLPTLGFHFVAQGLTRQSRTAAALHGAMLTVGLALVLLGLWGPLQGALVQFGWLLLAFGLAISIVRAPHLFALAAVVMTPVLAILVAFTVVDREYLVVAVLLVLLAFSVRWPRLQVAVAILAIVLAAIYTAGFGGDAQTFKLGIRAVGVLVALIVGIAALQASGRLAAADKEVRGWWIARSEGKRIAQADAAALQGQPAAPGATPATPGGWVGSLAAKLRAAFHRSP